MIHATETSICGTWRLADGRVVASEECRRIESLVANLLQERARSPDGWSILYVDPTAGRLWEHTHAESSLHGGGPPLLRVLAPSQAHATYGYPDCRPVDLPPEVVRSLGPVQRVLNAAGYFSSAVATSPSFGDFSVSFAKAGRLLQIVRERGRFTVSGPTRQDLEHAGLWRAFPESAALAARLDQWLRER
jgi:hypothetical protein